MCAFVVLDLVFPCQAKRLAWKRFRSDLFCVEWDVKLQLTQSINFYILMLLCWLLIATLLVSMCSLLTWPVCVESAIKQEAVNCNVFRWRSMRSVRDWWSWKTGKTVDCSAGGWARLTENTTKSCLRLSVQLGQHTWSVASSHLIQFVICCDFWATVCKTVRPMLWDCCLVGLSVTLVYCGQTVGRIKMKLGTEVGLGPGHTVLDGDPAPPP